MGAEGEGSHGLLEILNGISASLNEQNEHEFNTNQEDISLLNKIIMAQERGDFIFVADLLEYELPRSVFWKIMNHDFLIG